MLSKLLNFSSSPTSHGGYRQVVSSNIQFLNFCWYAECARIRPRGTSRPLRQFRRNEVWSRRVGQRTCPASSSPRGVCSRGGRSLPRPVVRVGQWIGGSGQKNSSSFSFRIEGGGVSGNACQTHPSRPSWEWTWFVLG